MSTIGIPRECEKYLVKRGVPQEEWEVEAEAYAAILREIDHAEDQLTRAVYAQTFASVLEEGNLLFSYCLKEVLPVELRRQRDARERIKPIALFIELERVLASASHNDISGSGRWPLRVSGSRSQPAKRTRNIRVSEDLPEGLLRSYYEFGAHQFSVGDTIESIMRLIEDRYSLNFEDLERSRSNN